MVIVGNLLRGGQCARLIAEAIKIEVAHHILRGQRGAVGVSHVRADVERVLGGVLVHLGHLGGDPRGELQSLRVLVKQAVGQLVNHAAIRVKAGRGWIQCAEELRLKVGQDVAVLPCLFAAGRCASCEQGRCTQYAGDSAEFFHEVAFVYESVNRLVN